MKATAAVKITHTYLVVSGESTQRNHLSTEVSVDIWRDKLGARVDSSIGWTYSSFFADRTIIPTSEWAIVVFAGNSSAGWGNSEISSDWKIGFGLGYYKIIGGDFQINLNLSEFSRFLNALENCG